MSLQINEISSGDLEAYSVLKGTGKFTGASIFSLGVKAARQELNGVSEVVDESIDQTLLDELNREIALLRGENEALKLANSNLTTRGEAVASEELTEAREKILKLEGVIDSLGVSNVESIASEDLGILKQLADGSLSLKDFKANYGEKYTQVV
jgi:hypothetical protein